MPASKNPRLAYCEYVIPEPMGGTVVWNARLELMRAVQRVHPAMLQRLSTDVFPAYKALAETGFDFDAILWNPRRSPFTELGAVDLALIDLRSRIRVAETASSEASSNPMPSDGQIVLRKCAALRDALKAWGTAFNADVLWFLDETLRTLRGWYVAPDWRDALRWNPIGGVRSTLAWSEPFKFACEGWEMQTFTWAAYSRSVRERFEQQLAEYKAASRTLAESCGLVRAPHKYSIKNLEWFVLYQFAGLSSTRIAGRPDAGPDGRSESTILKGVKAAAQLIGWDSLRPTPGRPNRKIR